MSTDKNSLLEKAKQVLEKNWMGSYTVPSRDLYPHQWSWDTAFNVIGWSYIDSEKAWQDLESLFEAQWDNGMVPHIVFHDDRPDQYFPDRDYWQTGDSSALIQPPVHAAASWYLYTKSKNKKEAEGHLLHLYEHLFNWHKYLSEYRDPENSGLVTMFHPWETGLDNSPRWDRLMDSLEVDQSLIPDYQRVDTGHVDDLNSRPTSAEYDKFVYLIETYRKYDFNGKRYYQHSPFLVKDVVASSLFYAANKKLLKIAEVCGKDTAEIEKWIKQAEDSFLQYFCPDPKGERLFFDYDLNESDFIRKRTAASFIPLYAGLVSKIQAEKIRDSIRQAHFFGDSSSSHNLVPSTGIDQEGYQQVTYWRGPIWVNINWLIYQGLKKYGFTEDAENIKSGLVSLLADQGFYEYFDPQSGKGLGARDFSWSASLIIDLLEND